ncbi:TPA: hypothetical protein ACYSAU_000554 [Klebsiella variicola]|uniref:hypothetical protein n=1 Tax=Klebsiella variicola TaxID=244366 RepID=UPI0035AE2C35|nr:hypothetical protein [Klebsiella variicola subsp. variicola]
MPKRTQLQKVRDVRRIIDFVKEHGRITTEQLAEMTGFSIKRLGWICRLRREPGSSSAMVVRDYSATYVQQSILTLPITIAGKMLGDPN